MEKRWIWPFELEEQIGSGAMGVVFRARYVKNDRRVALKLLPKEVAANPTLAARFQREMEILKDLRHPHIVHAFGGTCEGDQWFYAMELVDSGTLATLLLEHGKLPWRQAVEFALQVCAALEYAHTRGVIHRDLKPGNLLLARSGKLKLGDFGLALVSAETRLTAAGKTMGSLHYMAPEQIQGKPPLSNKTDLYALGCVMFELLCGRTPFTGEAMAEVLQQHIRQPPPRVSSFALDCPIQLESLIAELLQKDPDRRPENAETVAARLREIDQDVTVKAPRFDKNRPLPTLGAETALAVTPATSSPTPRTWNRHLIAGMGVLLVACIWLFVSRQEQARLNSRIEAEFVRGLKHQQQAVRVFAARSLREIGPGARSALPSLKDAIQQDKDASVRAEIAGAIGEIGSGDPLLIAELRNFREHEEAPQVRDAIEKASEQLKKKPHGSSITLYVVGGLLTVVAGAGFWIWKQATAE
jgi:serine/threonine-protein kinase